MAQRRSGSGRRSGAGAGARYPENYGHNAKIYVSKPIGLGGLPATFARADIEFHGVDHAGASYEARVFVDNPTADHSTPLMPADGFVGCFNIFGHGGCFGDVGHCEVRDSPRIYDPRPAHPLTPAFKLVIATEAIRTVLKKGQKTMQVTVVPIVTGVTKKTEIKDVLKFEKISLVTYS